MAVTAKRLCNGLFGFSSQNAGIIACRSKLKSYLPRAVPYLSSVRKLSDKVEDKEKTESKKEDEKTDEDSADPYRAFPDGVNPVTKERDGPKGPEPTRYGDWERKGRCIDF